MIRRTITREIQVSPDEVGRCRSHGRMIAIDTITEELTDPGAVYTVYLSGLPVSRTGKAGRRLEIVIPGPEVALLERVIVDRLWGLRRLNALPTAAIRRGSIRD